MKKSYFFVLGALSVIAFIFASPMFAMDNNQSYRTLADFFQDLEQSGLDVKDEAVKKQVVDALFACAKQVLITENVGCVSALCKQPENVKIILLNVTQNKPFRI